MFAPWPTKNEVFSVLLVCLTDCSAVSAATVVVTVYLPLTAVQVPIVIAGDEAPAASDSVNEPDMDLTVVPLVSLTTIVTPCEPEPEAMLPWFLMVAVNVTVEFPLGLPGDQAAL